MVKSFNPFSAPKKSLKTTLKIFFNTLFLLVIFLNYSYADQLTASVDRNKISSGETLQLDVKWDSQVSTDPDFSALEHDFEILSRQQQNQLSIINGKTQSYTSWTLELLPKREGKLLIPSFNYKGEVSNAILVEVSKASQHQTSDAPVYVETEVDKQQLHVQEQLLLTHRVITRVNLQGIANDELTIPGATVVKVSENQFQKQINGVQHLIVEVKYAIFPQNSGQLEIPALRFSTIIADRRDPFGTGLFSRGGKRVFLNSEAKTLQVLSRPDNSGNSDWLPSSGVSLSERWSRPLDEWRAGEPITRTVTLTAQGLTAVQLPPLSFPTTQNVKVYPDQPQLDDKLSSSGVIGQRQETLALVPSQPGEISLPPITVNWWDTKNQRLQKTVLEGRTIRILPMENATSEAGQIPTQNSTETIPVEALATPPNTGLNTWVVLLAITNLVLLAVVIGLLITRRNVKDRFGQTDEPPQIITEQQCFSKLKQTAQQQNQTAFREATINWAKVFAANPELNTLDAVAKLASRPEQRQQLQQQFEQLDAALYATGETTEINLQEALDLLTALRKHRKRRPANSTANLKPLYGR